jgi:hypothetical protein
VTKQGSPNSLNNANVVGGVVELDLDAVLAEIDVSPRPVKLGGVTYMVRRDLTAQDVVLYWELVKQSKDAEALALLVGDNATALNAFLEQLPKPHAVRAGQVIMQQAGLLTAEGEQGEAKAS